ncbi:MAG: hypothetical protein ACO2ON_03895 [Candidatus Nanopusillus sp.]
MAYFLQWLVPLIIGFIVSLILSSDKAVKKILNISNRMADAYYNKKKEKLKKTYGDLNDDLSLLILSNEIYKIEYVKKPQFILIIYLIIYSAIITSIATFLYILDYNVIVYALSIPAANLIYLLAIKIKQKLKAKVDNR